MGWRCIDSGRSRTGRSTYALAVTFALVTAADSRAQAENVSEPPPALSERAIRDAEGPMRWIKLHSELLRKSEERKATAAAASAAKATKRTEAAPSLGKTGQSNSPTPKAAARTPADQRATSSTEESLDSGLIIIDEAQPEWDEEDLAKLKKGRVVVRFHVAEDGYLSRIQIVESTNPRLTGPAMAAVMQWRFQPIKQPRVATAEFGFDITKQRGMR